jgi:hypothetical protein
MTGRRLAGASTAVGVALAAVALAFVGQRLASNWDDVSDSLETANPAWIVAAVTLAATGMTAIALPWRRALRLLGGSLAPVDTVARYYLGELGKYIPGGLWPVVGRGELARRGGVARSAAYGSVALSLAALYLAAMFLVVAGAPAILSSGSDAGRYLWALALLPVGVIFLHHAVLARVRRLGESLLGRTISAEVPRWRDSLVLVACYVPAWLSIGTATWAVARGLGQDVSWLDVAPAAVLSWIVGFVLVPVPGGMGVREATFVAAAGALDPGVAAAVALLTRLVFMTVDAVGALIASAWLSTRPSVGGSVVGVGDSGDGPAAFEEEPDRAR